MSLEPQGGDLVGPKTSRERFRQVTCMPAQYEKTVNIFSKNPSSTGDILNWVCRNNKDYLNCVNTRVNAPSGSVNDECTVKSKPYISL